MALEADPALMVAVASSALAAGLLVHSVRQSRRAKVARQQMEEALRSLGDPLSGDGPSRHTQGDLVAAAEDVVRQLHAREEATRERARADVRTEKLATIGSLSSGVAHEINNPLAFMRSNTQFFLRDCEEVLARTEAGTDLRRFAVAAREFATVNLQGADRIAKIVRSLSLLARPQTERARIDLAAVVEASLALTAPRIGQSARILADVPPSLVVFGSADGLGQVVLNLLVNAADAVPRGRGIIRVAAHRDGDVVRVEIEDNGPGVAPEHRSRIFTPFFTTKEKGTGLGLSISQRIVEDHGGRLWYDPDHVGARFVVELPAAPNEEFPSRLGQVPLPAPSLSASTFREKP